MVDQSVLKDWWEQLGMNERVALLYCSDPDMSDSDKAVLKCSAGMVAQGSYPSYRREIQEIIEKAFLDGREENGFWFGIAWTFKCPQCEVQSNEKGSIRFLSEDPRELREFLTQQSATCMNCGKTPPQGVEVEVQAIKAPLVVLRELGYAVPDPECPMTGTRYSDAWVKGRWPAQQP
jgi:hypothetical protein